MKAWLVGLGIATSAFASTAYAGVKEGVEAWVAGDYPKAVSEWKAPAAAGDPDAQFNLGQAYKLGRGVPMDAAIATDWYRKAAASDHEQAQATLGLQLFQSNKRDEAMIWLKKAAEHGEPRAQYVVGTAYFNGDSLPKDWSKAYAFMTRAKAAGIGAADTSLAQMDQLIPDVQKQSGLALAREMERTEQLRMVDQGAGNSPLTMRTARGAPVASISPTNSGKAPTPVAKVDVPSSTPTPPPVQMATVTPAPKPVPAKPVVATSAGGWKIQLGAFSTLGAAQTAWAKISKAAGMGALSPSYVPNGTMMRLQAGPFATRAAASQACSAAAGAATACFPVGP